MATRIGWLLGCLWLAWAGYWAISARGVKPARRLESRASRLGHFVPLGIAGLLLAIPKPQASWLSWQLVPKSVELACAGAALTAVGLLLCVWARRTLGTNWSGAVTVKQDHELVIAGPYRYVRHPIYSGLLLAFCGSALALGEVRAILALLIAWLALWRKWRLEERFMRETFGAAYSDYAARTPAVVPRLF